MIFASLTWPNNQYFFSSIFSYILDLYKNCDIFCPILVLSSYWYICIPNDRFASLTQFKISSTTFLFLTHSKLTFKNIVKILCLVKNMLYLCSFAIVIYIVMIVCGEPLQKIQLHTNHPSCMINQYHKIFLLRLRGIRTVAISGWGEILNISDEKVLPKNSTSFDWRHWISGGADI